MPMSNHEAISMMARAEDEIKRLRRRIEALEPRAEAFNVISQIMSYLPQGAVGMSEDVLFTFRMRSNELKKEIEDELSRTRTTESTRETRGDDTRGTPSEERGTGGKVSKSTEWPPG